ncbi:hypothetical protein TNCV_4073301 [Trichonephila clavipes]|uniref:Uncharacterized protein n=1 Tax=Trichonephila clavipes TaxID=2585209 RepID=A0A8X7BGZ8_TRICX|nr:hypothetical protein TNCV_4073301 [Trichonephila clavipes]
MLPTFYGRVISTPTRDDPIPNQIHSYGGIKEGRSIDLGGKARWGDKGKGSWPPEVPESCSGLGYHVCCLSVCRY